MKRFEVLDSFRGICALSVVFYHLRLVGSVTELTFFRSSSFFVDFFFVLSGFVLAHGYGSKKELKFLSFMKLRFFRIYPLHFAMFLVFFIIEVGKFLAYKYGGFVLNREPFTGMGAISEIAPNLLLLQSWLPQADAMSFNYPSWSISIEFYMYAMLFFTLLLAHKYRYLVWLIIPLSMYFIMSNYPQVLDSNIKRGLSAFFGGALVYVVYQKYQNIQLPFNLSTFLESVILTSIIYVVQSRFQYREFVVYFLFHIAVLFFAFEGGYFSKLLKGVIFQKLGKLSYSIYMTHAGILLGLLTCMMVLQKILGKQFAPMINGYRFLDSGSVIGNNMIAFIILALVIIVSIFTHKHIELKWQAYGNSKLKTPAKAF